MLKTAAKAIHGAVKNSITSTGALIFAATTGAHSYGMTYPLSLHAGHPPVDLVVVGMAVGGAIIGVGAKDFNSHSTTAEVQQATQAAQPPAVGQ